jgi:hypothetical protein
VVVDVGRPPSGEISHDGLVDPITKARIAGQSGLLTRAQARAAGLTERAIDWRLGSGRWSVIHPGVYLTAPGRDDWEMRAVAALLHAGTGAVLSGRSAGHVWGLVRAEPAAIEVSVPWNRIVRAPAGIVVKRGRHVADRTHPTEWRTGALRHTRFGTWRRSGTSMASSLSRRRPSTSGSQRPTTCAWPCSGVRDSDTAVCSPRSWPRLRKARRARPRCVTCATSSAPTDSRKERSRVPPRTDVGTILHERGWAGVTSRCRRKDCVIDPPTRAQAA